ncbi:zinc-binding dehydrogenase [Lichenicoccus sp.]|uniref:zinc-binding dehydrogenase n=1 Tax=Lichenicoccus sp. TaxID=2781899 RepID=UPI003D10F484
MDFSDMLIIEDRYQMHPPHPSSPRAEIVGNRAFVAREPARSLTSIADLLRLYAEGKLSLKVSETLPLARVGNAIMAWLQGTAIGKRVIAIA